MPYNSSRRACSRGVPTCATVRCRTYRLASDSMTGRTSSATDLEGGYMAWLACNRIGAQCSIRCRISFARRRSWFVSWTTCSNTNNSWMYSTNQAGETRGEGGDGDNPALSPDPSPVALRNNPKERATIPTPHQTYLGVVQEHKSVPLRRHVLRGDVQHVEQGPELFPLGARTTQEGGEVNASGVISSWLALKLDGTHTRMVHHIQRTKTGRWSATSLGTQFLLKKTTTLPCASGGSALAAPNRTASRSMPDMHPLSSSLSYSSYSSFP